MQTIHKLSDSLIAQIAAGEVIERPSYVVKELIDNAIDANANRISIDIEEGGSKKIVVTDNGIGMSKQDIGESVKIHTTSKVHNEEQFSDIQTLGFRGEALASIAAVSQLTIESRREEDTIGTKLHLNAGIVTNVSMGMPKGTRVIVESLFSNVPARKKFLKAQRTEFKHIVDIVNNYASGHPHIAFELSHNGKSWFYLPPNQTFKERLIYLYGKEIEFFLLPINFYDSSFSLTGFITKPQLTSSILPDDVIIINNRPVNDKLIRQAVKEGYGVLLEPDTQPVFFFQITIPSEGIDVNVHPRKEQIHLFAEQHIFLTISNAVRSLLAEKEITFTSSLIKERSPSYGTPLMRTSLAQTLKKEVNEERTTLMTKSTHKKIMTIQNLYIVIETDSGMTIIDQHAAHERILYERYKLAFYETKNNQQLIELKNPITLDFSPNKLAIFEDHISDFLKIGFELEEFPGRKYRILKVSSLFKDRDIPELINSLIQDLEENIVVKSIDSESKKILAYLACRSAVKAGDPLTKDQITMIIEEIAKVPAGATCPHGRPVRIDIPLNDLHKLFKRK